jgi:hypothetical protein
MELGPEIGQELGHGTRGQDPAGTAPRPFFYLSLMPGIMGGFFCLSLMTGPGYLTFAMNKYDDKRPISHYLLWKFCAGEI